MIRALIFDYGATIDSPGVHWAKILHQAWLNAGIVISLDDFWPCYVCGERALAASAPIDASIDFRHIIYIKAEAELSALPGFGGDIGSAAASIADYCDRRARQSVRAAMPVLRNLASHYPMAVVSNFYGNLLSVLRGYGLEGCFDVVIDSALEGVRKPDPAIFRLGASRLGVSPAEVLVVGDSLTNDIAPAHEAGMFTAWLCPDDQNLTNSAPIYDFVLKNLSDLADTVLTSDNTITPIT